jgi:succinyl-CoA synthetase beta subunit
LRLTEREAKAEFAAAGIRIPKGLPARDAAQAVVAVDEIGLPCVIKAQVLSGGRGKAGLVRVVKSREEALAEAARILSHPVGVPEILVEECVGFVQELYLGISYDPVSSQALVLASSEGGMDIEELAARSPEKIARVSVDITTGLEARHARSLVFAMDLKPEYQKAVSSVLANLWSVFKACDAELAEINPIFLMADGTAIAGDGKLAIDDNSAFRHPKYPLESRPYDSDIARDAALEGIPYLQFDGNISLMCAGAGLTTTVYDLVADAGGSVANYLEFGGPNYRKGVRAMELCLANNPKVVLIVTFGTIARADVMAQGIAEAIGKLKPTCPIVACIRGTGEEEAWRILRGIGIEPLSDTEVAVETAVRLSGGKR